jgi:hypothetical protein
VGVKPDSSQLKVYGSPAYAVLPLQKIDGKGDLRTEKGRYMGVGKAGILFLPNGGRTIVERKSGTVVVPPAALWKCCGSGGSSVTAASCSTMASGIA